MRVYQGLHDEFIILFVPLKELFKPKSIIYFGFLTE